MPTYEYACKSCGQHLEVVQSFKDEALTTCPACGGPLRKVFGAIGIAFKGSGFYKTDSRTAAKDSPAKKAASGDGGGGSGGEAGGSGGGADSGVRGDSGGREPAKADRAKASPAKGDAAKSASGSGAAAAAG